MFDDTFAAILPKLQAETFDQTFGKPLTLIADITLPHRCHTFGSNPRHIFTTPLIGIQMLIKYTFDARQR